MGFESPFWPPLPPAPTPLARFFSSSVLSAVLGSQDGVADGPGMWSSIVEGKEQRLDSDGPANGRGAPGLAPKGLGGELCFFFSGSTCLDIVRNSDFW